MNSADASFFYQFGIGVVIFAAGLVLGHRNGDWSLRRGERREAAWLAVMFLCYFVAQGYLQFIAPRS